MSIDHARTELRYVPGLSGDVVASLHNDGRAESIATVAVAEARRRGARLRFLQVVQDGLTPDERADADQSTFRGAVRALRGVRGIPCRFELVTGDPTAVLVDLTRSASVIIVGDDVETGVPAAAACRATGRCPVISVPVLA